MQIALSLNLPRDELTVSVARRILRGSMREVGVEPSCLGDIEIALSEACTNVLKHSGPGDSYVVNVNLDGEVCIIRVIDTGRGFDFESLAEADSDAGSERGRGLQLMRALVDDVKFLSKPEAGTVVHLEKSLEYTEASLARRLDERHRAAGDRPS